MLRQSNNIADDHLLALLHFAMQHLNLPAMRLGVILNGDQQDDDQPTMIYVINVPGHAGDELPIVWLHNDGGALRQPQNPPMELVSHWTALGLAKDGTQLPAWFQRLKSAMNAIPIPSTAQSAETALENPLRTAGTGTKRKEREEEEDVDDIQRPSKRLDSTSRDSMTPSPTPTTQPSPTPQISLPEPAVAPQTSPPQTLNSG